ncbi:MAG: bacterial Ig-like domain family protein [Massilia sp.]|nr:bacterial Ig-like domain family protein [Massilia sp.]
MQPMKKSLSPAIMARYAAIGLFSASLAACGGGGGSAGTTGGSTVTPTTPTTPVTPTPVLPTVTLALSNAAGQAVNALSAGTPLVVKATVKDKDGKPVSGALVTFATETTLAVFSPSVGTALTDASGVASVTMRPASLAADGAGKVTVTADVGGASIVSSATFSVGATALTLGPLSLQPAAIAAYGSTTLSVDVLAAGARYTGEQLAVSLSSACVTAGKATLAATVNTTNGTAQAVYRDLGCATRDTISASVQGAVAPASAILDIASPAAASVQFSSATPVDQSIVIKGQGGISRTETATLKFKVFDIFGKPLAGQLVKFGTTTTAVTVNKAVDTTDQNGEVITTVNSGSQATTFRVQATLESGISTLSDSIVVTTGLAVQKAFSLSTTASNLEGLSYDSGVAVPAAFVNVLIADQFGNPVPDGTPVVFQTNLGAVGSSNKGGCNTVNGGCSVDFRTQDPRSNSANTPGTPCNNYGAGGVGMNDATRPGVATICASSTDGTNTIFKKTALFFSGSSASNVYLNGSATRLPGIETDLGTVGASESKVFSLLISDVNNNPMPFGTKISIANINNGTAVGAAPDTVQNIFPHSASGDDLTGNTISGNQGSYHTITIGSTQPTPCTKALVSTFNVNITTPKAVTTTYPFKVTFSCP